jgi:hypothetical protein
MVSSSKLYEFLTKDHPLVLSYGFETVKNDKMLYKMLLEDLNTNYNLINLKKEFIIGMYP